MSSILGHTLAGLVVCELARCARGETFRSRRWPAVFAGAAMSPDVDTLLGAALGPDRIGWLCIANRDDPHRGLTHTLAFALAAGLLGIVFAHGSSARDRLLRIAPWLVLAAVTHLALDALNMGPPLAFFWPISEARYAWPAVLPPASYSFSVARILESLTDPFWVTGFRLEAILLLPLLILARLARFSASEKRPNAALRARTTTILAGTLAALGLWAAIEAAAQVVARSTSAPSPALAALASTEQPWIASPLVVAFVALLASSCVLFAGAWRERVPPQSGTATVTTVLVGLLSLVPTAHVVGTLARTRHEQREVERRDHYPALSWSADAARVVFSRVHGELSGIYVIDVAGHGLSRVAAGGSSPACSPVDAQLAYCAPDSESLVLGTLHDDGFELTSPPVKRANVSAPAWSPDGSMLAFASSSRSGSAIHVHHTRAAESARTSCVAEHLRYAFDLEWSPDSSRLAFVTQLDDNFEICVLEVAGSRWVRLTNDPADDRGPAWSPDGTRIAFSHTGGESSGVRIVDVHGSTSTGLAPDAALVRGASSPRWSPDGSKLLFVRTADRDLCVVGRDAWDHPSVIATNVIGGHWSPDGRRIAVQAHSLDDSRPGHRLFVVDEDGSRRVELMPSDVTPR